MAVVDISTKLGKEKQTIKIAEGKVYEVDTSADNYLLVQEKLKNKEFSIEVMYEMIEMLLGKEALQTINEVDFEEMEKRFQ